MKQHLTEDDFAHPQLDALQHIAECEECADRAREAMAPQIARIEALLADEAAEPPRHLTSDELFSYVDGLADAKTRAHIEECDLCRDDVRDLLPLRPARLPRRWMWLAAAAVAAVLLMLLFRSPQAPLPAPPRVIRATPPHPDSDPPTRYANQDWVRLVHQALESGRLSFPEDLAGLRGSSESLRGEARHADLDPAGVVVDSTTPSFRWPRIDNATYVVLIYDGEEEVVRSQPLTVTRWSIPEPLRRGRTYGWQVEAKRNDLIILPSPPDPPARFRVTSREQHEELEAARRLYPGDHLLLAALSARAGLEREANEHLQQIARSSDPRIARLKSGQ